MLLPVFKQHVDHDIGGSNTMLASIDSVRVKASWGREAVTKGLNSKYDSYLRLLVFITTNLLNSTNCAQRNAFRF
jgi:hypothetical protein